MTGLVPGATDAPTKLTAGCPDDVLALVPLMLGFHPRESVAMLTFGAAHAFHARIDLPPASAPPDDVEQVLSSLLEPSVRHGVERVVLVVYSAAAAHAVAVAHRLRSAFEGVGIEVVELLRADGERWWPVPIGGEAPGSAGPGVAYDVTAHPFLVQGVLAGRVTRGSREEIAEGLRPEPARVRAVAALVERTEPPAAVDLVVEGGWVESIVAVHTEAHAVPSDEVAARLLLAVRHPVLRDAACTGLTRASAPAHVELWAGLVRRTPPHLVAEPATLLALAAWQSGEGALAWCALDVAQAAEPDHPLAGLVARALTTALPPSTWRGVEWRAGLP